MEPRRRHKEDENRDTEYWLRSVCVYNVVLAWRFGWIRRSKGDTVVEETCIIFMRVIPKFRGHASNKVRENFFSLPVYTHLLVCSTHSVLKTHFSVQDE